MNKMSDIAMTIEELRNAAAAINEAANWLAAQFSSEAEATPVVEAKPEKKPELTLEEVRAVLAEKSRAGHTAAIRTLLQKYGAKDGTNRGGAHIGAGAKKKTLADKIAEGNPGKRTLTVIDFDNKAIHLTFV